MSMGQSETNSIHIDRETGSNVYGKHHLCLCVTSSSVSNFGSGSVGSSSVV